MGTVHDVVERIRAEYLEMPGLRLTSEQIQRLCGVEAGICAIVLDTLVQAKFLCLKADGQYARLTEGDVPSGAKMNAWTGIDFRKVS